MAISTTIKTILDADTKGLSSGLKRGAGEVQTYSQSVRSSLAELKDAFGRGSIFAQLVTGRFAIGLEIALRRLTDMVEVAGRLTREFQKGSIAGIELFSGIAEKIPILGDAYKLGEAISEAFSGANAKLSEEQKLNVLKHNTLQKINDEIKREKELREQIEDHIKVANTADETDKQILQKGLETQREIEKLREKSASLLPNIESQRKDPNLRDAAEKLKLQEHTDEELLKERLQSDINAILRKVDATEDKVKEIKEMPYEQARFSQGYQGLRGVVGAEGTVEKLAEIVKEVKQQVDEQKTTNDLLKRNGVDIVVNLN